MDTDGTKKQMSGKLHFARVTAQVNSNV
jgi:hypothetical protein